MDKKLEARIAKLEKMISRKSVKNEGILTNGLNKAIRGLSMADKELIELVDAYYGTDNPMRDRWDSMVDQIEEMIRELRDMAE